MFLDVTHKAATRIVSKLVSEKILKVSEPKRKRGQVYFAPAIVKLLDAELLA